MTTEATVLEYCDNRGRGTAVTKDGAVRDIACHTFDRKGPGTAPLDDVRRGTLIVFDRRGSAKVWRTVR